MIKNILRKVNLAKLSKRERYIVFAVCALLAVFVFVQVMVRPLFARNDRLHRKVDAQTAALAEMQKMRAEYQGLLAASLQSNARISGRDKGFTLYKFLNELAGDTGIKDNVSYMKPTTTEQKDTPYKISRVEMKLESITLAQLTEYLHRVETSPNVVIIKKIAITKNEEADGLLTAVLQVETLET